MKQRLNKNVVELSKDHHYLNAKDANALGLGEGENIPYLQLKFFDSKHQCFSEWTTDELKLFTAFIDKIQKSNWNEIFKSGSGTNKSGFGFTKCKDTSLLPNQEIVKSLSQDVNFFELRVSQKARVHGFRVKSAFCIVWLDRNHEIYK
jgi:hypothetical protein